MEENNVIIALPKNRVCRTKGRKYIDKNNNIVIWNGNSLHCEHNKRKSRCVDCEGVGICIHKRVKHRCVDCRGVGICIHKRIKNRCKDCNGSLICIHKKDKYRCKECEGSQVCIHKRIRTQCIECKGGNICVHNKQKAHCKICLGTSFCSHNKRKDTCTICCSKSAYFCIHCNFVVGKKRYISSKNTYEKLCADCYYHLYPDEKKIPTKYKKKQHFIHEKLQEKYGSDFFKYDVKIECGCSGKIPDWFADLYKFTLNIECDENQHKGNETSCENKRLCELFLDCNSRPFVCIRFNPDSYKIKDKKIEGCFEFDEKNNVIVNQEEFEKRFDLLVEKIDYYLENGSKKDIECIKLFYDS